MRSDWASPGVREVVIDHLEDRNVRGLPALVEAWPELMAPGVRRVGAAAHRLWRRRGEPVVGRANMQLNVGLEADLDE